MQVEDSGKPLEVLSARTSCRGCSTYSAPHRPQTAAAECPMATIHRSPPPLSERSTKSEVFETGIKAIDVLVPLERGGKAGLFVAWLGKTVLLTE